MIKISETHNMVRLPTSYIPLRGLWRDLKRAPNEWTMSFEYILDTQLKIIIGEEFHNGQWWCHVAISRPAVLPTYSELVLVKDTFLGDHRTAIMVLPPEDRRINIHPFCLHLYAQIDQDGRIPDFRFIDDTEALPTQI